MGHHPVGLIICAISGWFCFSSRILVISRLGVPAAQLVGRRSWRRGQTAGGGSIPRWSTGKSQVVTRRKATGAGQKKILVISRLKAAGSSTTSAFSVRKWPVKDNGNKHFAAIFLDGLVGRARTATALFSHRVRSHSSRALCAKVPVCGGAF